MIVYRERTMKTIFDTGGLLAGKLPGFESRPGQLQMAEAVQELLEAAASLNGNGTAENFLLVEAETGIGKTLAYLVPAVLSGRRVVVSTATINLQDQILQKEVPLIESIFAEDLKAICVKGRQNYLCRYRWNQYGSSPQLRLVDDNRYDMIADWLKTTVTGDRAELEWLSERSPLWANISATSNQCLGGECPDASLCFVNQLRKKAGSSRLLIVNHHLFFSDLALKQEGYGEILPRYEVVIFDEAHHLENVATLFFGKSFSGYQFLDLLGDVERLAEAELDADRFDRIVGYGRGLKKRVDRFMTVFPPRKGRYPLSRMIEEVGEWQGEVERLSAGLISYGEQLGENSHFGEGWKHLEHRCLALNSNLLEIGLPDSKETLASEQNHYVHWYERRQRSITLSATPIKVASELREFLYPVIGACVFTSATLTTADSFSYVRDRLGLEEGVKTMRLQSPFDYQGRTLLYVPENAFPSPTERQYGHMVCERVCELLQASRGRALVLFTSFKGMDSMADYLADRLPFPVLVQGQASRQGLLQQFTHSSESVLLAVASFWEGVDVPGESLSCVIIDKLPFEVPDDPVMRARMDEITASGGRPFFDFQVPRAVLTLRQGVGRLMRATTDRGLLAIMDVRLFTKGYGRTFLASLPPSPIVRSVQPVFDFFKG